MAVDIITKKKEIEEGLKFGILRFVGGEVPVNRALVIIRTQKGIFVQYSDSCDINCRTGNGRMINTRCVGAYARRDEGERIFVVWRLCGSDELKIREYDGRDIFPESENLW